MPTLALVTVLFKSDDVLEGFLKSLSIQTFKDFHLYLVDNDPNEQTDKRLYELLKRYSMPGYTHIKNEGNAGVARGNNQGIAQGMAAGCTHTVLLNNDIEFSQPELLGSMLRQSVEQGEALIIPKILYFDTRKIWMAGGILEKHKGTNIHVGDKEEDGPRYNQPGHFDYAPTCFMLIDNRVFSEIGLMDELFFVYYDDIDFIYRATLRGYLVYYMPSLVVLHKVSSSTGGTESLFSIYYSNRNRILFLRKNLRGLGFLVPLLFTLSTRVIKYFGYSVKERKQLKKAVVDGLKMKYA